jgi:lipid II:glycine glycyltransferase (peptidoglycan interpeptide bridge formation enzyme)
MRESSIYFTSDSRRVDTSEWEQYVLAHPQGNFFQSPVAYRVFNQTRGYTPNVLFALNKKDNKLCGILLSVVQQESGWYSALTSRSIVWGGPLADSGEIAAELLREYDRTLSQGVIYTQIRNLFEQSTLIESAAVFGYSFSPHLNILVATTGKTEKDLLTEMSKSKARQIRKGLDNCTIEICNSTSDLNDLYSILKNLYRIKAKKPLPDISFFQSFYNETAGGEYGSVFIIRHKDRIIGGMVAPKLPGKKIYEWYVAGDDTHYKECYPSVLATWAAIRQANTEGMRHFDFLGAGKPDADYGVREFKARFGGTEVNYGRFEKIHRPILMKIGTFGLKALSQLKTIKAS